MSFKDNVILSFKRIRADIDSLKDNVTEWLAFINTRQANAELRIAELEKRINDLERNKLEVY